MRQGRELERQRRHVKVEALRDAPGRLEELRRSFQDLVMLNDVFRELSSQKLI